MANKRQIVIDEEMTGLDLDGGDRMVEIAGVELLDGAPTGKTFHAFINPDGRPMSPIAAELTGLTDDFLAQQPSINTVAKAFAAFAGDAEIIVFCWGDKAGGSPDQNFLSAEMKRAGLEPFSPGQFTNIRDWASKMYSLGEGSLNQMLDHYKIDRSGRDDETGHGALIDAELTAKLYPKLKADWKKHNDRIKTALHPSTTGLKRPGPAS